MTNVAVVILNYNGSKLLKRFLPSVIQFSERARVIIADNGSSDDSVEVIRKDFPSIELIMIPENLGFCGGYNRALKSVEAEYYILLNSDVEVTPGWIDPMRELLDNRPDVASVQPKILSQRNKELFEYAGAGGGFIDSLGYPFCRGRLFYALETDHHQFDDQKEIFWSSGACMMIRSVRFREMGGFDEDFFAHMEEIDLCWRLQRAGHKIYYQGLSTVYHVGGGTLSAANPRKTYFNFKNGLSLLFKNLPAHELALKLPVRIVLDWVAALKFTLSGAYRDGGAVLKAHLHFFSRLKRETRRRGLTRQFGFRKPDTRYTGLVVWDFFILGKRKYSELVTRREGK